MSKIVHSSLLTVVFAMLLYGGFTAYSGGVAVFDAVSSLSWQVWGLILALSLANYLLRYWRWHLYISHGQALQLSHLQHLAIYIAGFSLTMTPGKAGEAMRSLYLKGQGVAHQRSLAALFVERIMDLLAILLLAAIGLFLLNSTQSTLAAAITSGLIMLCLLLVKLPKAKILESALFAKLPQKLQKLVGFVVSMLGDANDLLSMRFIFIGLAIGLVAWGLEGLGLYYVMQSFSISQSDIFLAVAIYAAAVLLGAISFLPGGLGGTEAAMIFMLVKVGFDVTSATAITFICRVATLWFAVALGLLTMLILPKLGIYPSQQTATVDAQDSLEKGSE